MMEVPTQKRSGGMVVPIRKGPDVDPTYLAMAAAMMHQEGRFFQPQGTQVAGDVIQGPFSEKMKEAFQSSAPTKPQSGSPTAEINTLPIKATDGKP